jgi:hypothetical protein
MALYRIRKRWQLPKEEAETVTYAEVQEGIFFRGHNLWLLVLAMMIACIGLNYNNQAAIIGAMLISPLMGPIIGFSFGLSIQSKSMIKVSLQNWLVMVGTSIAASTIYFLLSPFHKNTDQLLAFTEVLYAKKRLKYLPVWQWPQLVFPHFVQLVLVWLPCNGSTLPAALIFIW